MLKLIKKLIIFIVIATFLYFLLSRGTVYDKEELTYGVTFSKKQAESLNLDWKEMYLAMLEDLGVKKIRLSAYWNEVENKNDEFYFDDVDWQLEEANKHGVEVILAIGGRLPRWPECHFPDWTKNLAKQEVDAQLLKYLEETVVRYRDHPEIKAWQIENEPFLSTYFGECPKTDRKLLDLEIELVRRLDSRPIVITDSGELSIWVRAAKRADIFGTTMYLNTYSKQLGKYIHYPITPSFFRIKKNLVRIFAHPKNWIVIEMQAEPWGKNLFQNISKSEREITFSFDKFDEILEFGRQAGFKEFYLWGVEYWYWEKEVNGDSRYWEKARTLF